MSGSVGTQVQNNESNTVTKAGTYLCGLNIKDLLQTDL